MTTTPPAIAAMLEDCRVRQTILRTQRDALAFVVFELVDPVRTGRAIDVKATCRRMMDAGLLDRGVATREQAERFGVPPGELITELSPFGRAAMEGVRR